MSPEGSSVAFRGVSGALRRPVERFAERLKSEVTRGRGFDCIVASDAELRRLNREFRGIDAATDVLSFPAEPRLPYGRGSVKNGRGLVKNLRGSGTAHGTRRILTEPGPLGSGGSHLGDLAISLTRARAQARAFGHQTAEEIQILMLHGVLHLLGMDHETDQGKMARAEKRWRARLGLPAGLIERVQS